MSDEIKATQYPLCWPAGWARTPSHRQTPGRFSDHGRELSVSRAIDRLDGELSRLGVPDWNVILSTNLRLGMRGAPLADQPQPSDRGVAVYFKMKGKPRVLACDKFTKVADNIAALAAHIECIRGVERYGVGTLEQAFTGYDALPPPGADNRPAWRAVFNLGRDATIDQVERVYRSMARQAHPDNGGNHDTMAALNVAIEAARKELS